ncbi:Hypothetical protein PHPALM_8820 [Phytophthora palmivora]|uniref:Uncharacterized protein n=1 Tax=Phytophthora palmivora TaxID=4796 RepID=A0A2P4Y8W7_9STRA|nr:Hypothetical protein PHPALM_8820 [Phytophthora palmivora]
MARTATASRSSLLLQVEAHQVVYVPTPTWTRPNTTSTERSELWKPLAFLENEGYTTHANFTQYLVDNGFKSLRDFMDNGNYSVTDGADQACGWTDPEGIPQQIPEDGTMRTSGYTHDGPCEIYMGDTLALSYLNCHESITDQTFKLDYSGCGDSCVLYWYWLGVRYLKRRYSWQVYKECIPMYSESTGSSIKAPLIESPSTGSVAASEAEFTSSQKSGSLNEVLATAPSTDVPPTPTTGTSKKCSVSSRRIRR